MKTVREFPETREEILEAMKCFHLLSWGDVRGPNFIFVPWEMEKIIRSWAHDKVDVGGNDLYKDPRSRIDRLFGMNIIWNVPQFAMGYVPVRATDRLAGDVALFAQAVYSFWYYYGQDPSDPVVIHTPDF